MADERERDDGPVWPDGAQVDDEAAHRVTLTISPGGHIELGPEHAGWDVTIKSRPAGAPPRLSTPAEVDLVVRVNSDAVLDCPGARVHLAPGKRVHFERWPHEVVARGNVDVDGPDGHGYRLVVDPERERPLVVGGSAPVREVAGAGTVQLNPGFGAGHEASVVDGFTGELTVPGLSDVTIESPTTRLHSTGPVDRSTIVIESIRSEGAVEDSVIQAGHIRAPAIRRSIVSAEDAGTVNVVVAHRGNGRTPDHLPDAPTPNSLQGWAHSRGPIEDSIVCSSGDLVAGAIESSTITITGSMYATDDVAATTIAVEGSCKVDGPVTVAVDGSVDVRGDLVVGGDLACNDDPAKDSSRPKVKGGAVTVKGSTCGVELIAETSASTRAVEASRICAQTITVTKGDCGGADLDGGAVVINGSVTDTSIAAATSLDASKIDATCTVTLAGDADLPEGVDAPLTWAPTTPSASLRLAGRPAHLHVTSTGHPKAATAVLVGVAPWPAVEVTGHVHLAAAIDAKSFVDGAEAVRVTSLTVNEASHLETSGSIAVDRLDARPGVVVQASEGALSIPLEADHRVTLDGPGAIRCTTEDTDDAAAEVSLRSQADVDLLGGELGKVTGQASTGSSVAVPTLSVQEGAVVRRLAGDVRLGKVHGRVEAPPRRGKEGAPTPRVHAIESDGDNVGIVLGVDPTPCDDVDLERISTFRVFEAEPTALRRWARAPRPQAHLRRSAAVTGQLVASQVKGTAASGTARASATWAAAHTHAQTVPPVESLLRLAHRALGYSQRPVPPLVTYGAIAGMWVVTGIVFDIFEPKGWHGWLDTIVGVFLYPASFLARIPNSGGDTLFEHPWQSALAFFTIGLPLVFTVVALRNFMAPPDTD